MSVFFCYFKSLNVAAVIPGHAVHVLETVLYLRSSFKCSRVHSFLLLVSQNAQASGKKMSARTISNSRSTRYLLARPPAADAPPLLMKPVLRFLVERPRVARRIFFSAPEGSKGAPRGPQEASSLPGQLQELSKRLQDRFWSNLGIMWGAILELFWNNLGTSLITGRRQMITRT